MTLSAENIEFFYERRFPVLENISFSVKKGEFIGIFGPNGGGKTTLLKLLLGLISPVKGKVHVMGHNPKDISEKIGYVPQIRYFDKQFPISVIEVVLQGCLATYKGWGNFSKENKRMALEALEKVGMKDKAEFPFGALSGGQIQRTLIARALVSNPEILLLDEAMVGIDQAALKDIYQFLISLRGQITILLVTHDLQVIASEMDRFFCVQRELTHYSPEKICEHFAMGLYHPPLMKIGKKNV